VLNEGVNRAAEQVTKAADFYLSMAVMPIAFTTCNAEYDVFIF